MRGRDCTLLLRRTAWFILIALLPVPVFGQSAPSLVIFDEDDPTGAGYYDASYGFASGGSSLALGAGSHDKLLIVNAHAYSGSQSGLLQWTSAPGGAWKLFVSSPAWTIRDASARDSLEFYVNAPVRIDASGLPVVALESSTNVATRAVSMSSYLSSGIDVDSSTWQRIVIPLSAFQPFGSFSLAQFKDVHFGQGTADNVAHTLWFDYVRLIGGSDTTHPAAPANVVTRVGDRCVILHWDFSSATPLTGCNIYRSVSPAGPFVRLNPVPVVPRAFIDLTVTDGSAYDYYVTAVSAASIEGAASDTVQATPHVFADDEQFLDFIEQTAVDYFWYEANPANGLIKDRSALWSACSIASTGFGLTALCIGVDRGWIARADARDRTLAALTTFWTQPQGTAASGTIGHNGFFYHFLDMSSAVRTWNCELSSGDTGDLIAGVLYAKQYFNGTDSLESRVRALADSITDRVDWAWMMNGESKLAMAWYPERGFDPYRYEGYNEAMVFYIIGLGASVHPMPAGAWSAWTSTYSWQTHYTYSFVVFPPLFGHQASHSWIDFRNVQDAYMKAKGLTYFENSRRATLAQRAYCIANPLGFPGYGANIWGLTASDEPSGSGYQGYLAHGAPPSSNDNGTLAPTAPASSVPFTPDISIAALHAMYDHYRSTIMTPYGFCDAFNLKENWWDPDVIGFDLGTTALMIENYRTGSVWARFMQNPVIQQGMQQAGFTAVASADSRSPAVPEQLVLHQNYPNPFNGATHIRFALPAAGHVRMTVVDMLGRVVMTPIDAGLTPGAHIVTIDATALASGVYIYDLQFGGISRARTFILLR